MGFGITDTPGAWVAKAKKQLKEMLARVASVEKTLSGSEKISGTSAPTAQVTAKVGQIYINVTTGEEWKCIAVNGSSTAWEKLTKSSVSLSAADVGASPIGHKHTKSEITDFPTSMPASDVSAWAKAASKPTYTAAEVGASPTGHKHTKSEITDFPTSMPASDVPAWAKSATKPTYSAAEVGARPSTWTPTATEVGARPSTWTPTAADVGAKASGWKPFHVGTTAPSDKTQLWIDTTANTGGLKYHNGSAWVPVPVAYAT